MTGSDGFASVFAGSGFLSPEVPVLEPVAPEPLPASAFGAVGAGAGCVAGVAAFGAVADGAGAAVGVEAFGASVGFTAGASVLAAGAG